jgi:hypothetical protein
MQDINVTQTASPDGEFLFSNLYLQGTSESTCMMIFTTATSFSQIPGIACNISLDGCPPEQKVSNDGSYDYCVGRNL